ncbi:unnamed protein product [Penicillium salamii]|nr:unnamed protein product [Penicillium salamii]
MMPTRSRRNIALACDSCRRRKIRCDGVEPSCGPCERRHSPCRYPGNHRRRLDNRHIHASKSFKEQGLIPNGSSATAHGESLGAPVGISARAQDNEIPIHSSFTNTMPLTARSLRPEIEDESSHSIAEGSNQPQLTAMGITPDRPSSAPDHRREFFGDSSIASFLKQIPVPGLLHRETPGGSAKLPNRETRNLSSLDLPSRPLADHLMTSYFDKFHVLYPFIHKPSILRAYRNIWAHGTVTDQEIPPHRIGLGHPDVQTSIFLSALNIIMALGCQFARLDPTTCQVTSAELLQRSRKCLHDVGQDAGDLALVQTFLLTAFYLQGGQSPSKCWNIIGLACRMAQGLGMHSLKADDSRHPAEIQMRRRVWHGCIMLDLASSMMLGRPPMIHGSVVPLPEAFDDEDLDPCTRRPYTLSRPTSKTEFLVQTLKLHIILRKVLLEVYERWENSDVIGTQAHLDPGDSRAQAVTRLDAELVAFVSCVPAALQWKRSALVSGPAQQFPRERTLLQARFLHLRILLLRPSLSRLYRESRLSQEKHAQVASETPLDEMRSRLSRDLDMSCATYCVETTIELSHLMNESSQAELASVWWYTIFCMPPIRTMQPCNAPLTSH